MDHLMLFWNLDVSNVTKLIVFSIFILLILCIICKPKNKKIDKYNKMETATEPTKCQIDYKMCQENIKRGNSAKDLCYVCKSNGDYPDKIYHPGTGYVKLNPKTGKAMD